jgi:hypothetical protein
MGLLETLIQIVALSRIHLQLNQGQKFKSSLHFDEIFQSNYKQKILNGFLFIFSLIREVVKFKYIFPQLDRGLGIPFYYTMLGN